MALPAQLHPSSDAAQGGAGVWEASQAGPTTAGDGPLEFNFLPRQVVVDLGGLGDWKKRAIAMECLSRVLAAVSDPAALLPSLRRLVAFLLTLLDDRNFKVAIGGAQVLADLSALVGRPMRDHLDAIVPSLIAQLADRKPAVATAAMRCLRQLMAAAGPQQLLDLLAPVATGAAVAPAGAREQALNAHIMAVLCFPSEALDLPKLVAVLLSCCAPISRSPSLIRRSSSGGNGSSGGGHEALVPPQALALAAVPPAPGEQERLDKVATEGFAALSSCLGPAALQPLLRAAGAAEIQIARVLQRTMSGELPVVTPDGAVVHPFDEPAATADVSEGGREGSSLSESSNGAGRSGAKLSAAGLSPVGGVAGTGLLLGSGRGSSAGGTTAAAGAAVTNTPAHPNSAAALAAAAEVAAARSIAKRVDLRSPGSSIGGWVPPNTTSAGRPAPSVSGASSSSPTHSAALLRSSIDSVTAVPVAPVAPSCNWMDADMPRIKSILSGPASACSSTFSGPGRHGSGPCTTSSGGVSTAVASAAAEAVQTTPLQRAAAEQLAANASVLEALQKLEEGASTDWEAAVGALSRPVAKVSAGGRHAERSYGEEQQQQQQGQEDEEGKETVQEQQTGSEEESDGEQQQQDQSEEHGSVDGQEQKQEEEAGEEVLLLEPGSTEEAQEEDSLQEAVAEVLPPQRPKQQQHPEQQHPQKQQQQAKGQEQFLEVRGRCLDEPNDVPHRQPQEAQGKQQQQATQQRSAPVAVSLAPAAESAWADATGGIPTEPGLPEPRAETLSPSKGERLALLKRLQQEKRSGSASGSGGRAAVGSGSGEAAPTGAWGSAGAGVADLLLDAAPPGDWRLGSGTGAAAASSSTSSTAVPTGGNGTVLRHQQPTSPTNRYQQLLKQHPPHQQQQKQQQQFGVHEEQQQQLDPPAGRPPSGRTLASWSLGRPGGVAPAASSIDPRQHAQQQQQQARGGPVQSPASAPAGQSWGPGWGDGANGGGAGGSLAATSPSPPGRAKSGLLARRRTAGDIAPLSTVASGRPAPAAASPVTPGSPGLRAGGLADSPSSGLEMSTAELTPLPDPEGTLRRVVTKLQQCNAAARKDLDWVGQTQAISEARRLVAHHSDLLTPAALHDLCSAAAPAVAELRSCTARGAIQLMSEMFVSLGPRCDKELEDCVPLLVKRAGEVSTAGRDNFLGQEADRALAAMCGACSPARAAGALLACTGARATAARSKVAAHLDGLLDGGGCRSMLAANWQLLERLFRAAAAFLEEGSLETRTHGKRLLFELRASVPSRSDWDRLMGGLRPEALHRKVSEVLEAPGPPPPPPSRGRMGSRLASRGSPAPGSPAASPAGACSPPSSSGSARGAAPPVRALFAQTSSGRTGGSASPQQQQHRWREEAPGLYSTQPLPFLGEQGGNNSGIDHHRLARPTAGYAAAASPSRRATARTGSFGNGSGSGAPETGRLSPPRRGAAAAASAVASVSQTMPEELSDAVDQVSANMASRDWRARADALRALGALAPVAGALSGAAMDGLMSGLAARLGDPNAKVLQQALETLTVFAPSAGDRINPYLGSLVPVLSAALGSAQAPLRAAAAASLDALARAGGPEPPGALLQHCAHVVCSGAGRGRAALVTKIAELAPSVHVASPGLVSKHATAAAFALVNEPRLDMRAAAGRLLCTLNTLLGEDLRRQIAALPAAAAQRRAWELLGSNSGGNGGGVGWVGR